VFILYGGLEKGRGGGNNKGNDGFFNTKHQRMFKD